MNTTIPVRVAIVDDDPSVIQSLKKALEFGCRKQKIKLNEKLEIGTFLNAEGLKELEELFDIYIVDFDMPSYMNGKEAAEMIEERHTSALRAQPIIFIHTANSDKFNFKEINVRHITLIEKSDHLSKSRMIQYIVQFEKGE